MTKYFLFSLGACFLFYGSVLLIFEARLALSTKHMEMDFIWRLTKHLAPNEEFPQRKLRISNFRRHWRNEAK